MNERVDRIPELALTEARVREIVTQELYRYNLCLEPKIRDITREEIRRYWVEDWTEKAQMLGMKIQPTARQDSNYTPAVGRIHPDWRGIAERLAHILRFFAASNPSQLDPDYRAALAAYDEAVRRERSPDTSGSREGPTSA